VEALTRFSKARGPREVRLIRPQDRDRGTSQTPGLDRETAIDDRSVGARTLWMGFVRMGPGARSAPHHHGASESGIYVIRGALRLRFGTRLDRSVDAHAGDFIYVPPRAVHQETNLSPEDPVDQIVVRDSPQNIVVERRRRKRSRKLR